jgi:hypothetical protein
LRKFRKVGMFDAATCLNPVLIGEKFIAGAVVFR